VFATGETVRVARADEVNDAARSGSSMRRIDGRALRRVAERWGVGFVAVGVSVVLLPILAVSGVTMVDFSDIEIYRAIGESAAAGALPYRDIPIEDPPAAVPLFVLPALGTASWLGYAIAFALTIGTLGMAGLTLAARVGTMLAPPTRAWLARTLGTGVMIGLLGAVALTRFDFVPAALTVATLYALLRDRFGWAGVLLGAATAVKLYPVVMLPVAAVYVLRRGGLRTTAAFIGLAAIVVLVTVAPFVVVAPDGVYESVRVQVDRPLQIESFGASLLWFAANAGVVAWPQQSLYYDLSSPDAESIKLATTITVGAMLALLWWRHARGPVEGMRLVRYSFASVAAFVLFGKVLSPQYLVWLALLVPALRGVRANAAAALLGAAVAATAIYFPRLFPLLIEGHAPEVLGLIAIRNLLLGALVAVLVWPDDRRATAAPNAPQRWRRGLRTPV
jgi:hypothetical protein